MKGPKPRPTELAIALGNPGHRALPDVVQVAGKGALGKPAALEGEAAKVWDEIVPLLTDAGLLDRIDAVILEGLCGLIARARYASKRIEQDGYTVAHAKTGIQSVSPWVRIERDAWAQAVKIGEHYGLTPVARTRLGLAVLKGRSLLQELDEGLA